MNDPSNPDPEFQQKRVEQQRYNLVLDQPFFGTVLMNLILVRCDDGVGPRGQAVDTMATDGKSILWNPNFTAQLSGPEIRTVLCHEVEHVVLFHPFRVGDRDLKKANIAMDYAVNNLMDQVNDKRKRDGEAIPFKWPESAPPYINRDWDKHSFEEIYAMLPDGGGGDCGDPGSDGEPGGSPQSSMGDVMPCEGDPAQVEAQKTRLEIQIRQAQEVAKQRGDDTLELQGELEKILNPTVPWPMLLKQFIRDRAQTTGGG